MQGSTSIEFKETKRGKWRAYEVEQRAHSHWIGPNFKYTVLRDPDDQIVERATEQELRSFLHLQRWYWVSYESTSLTEAIDLVREAKAEQLQQQAKG